MFTKITTATVIQFWSMH